MISAVQINTKVKQHTCVNSIVYKLVYIQIIPLYIKLTHNNRMQMVSDWNIPICILAGMFAYED
jgi:hypothetical protein